MAWIIHLPLEPGEAPVCVSNFSSSCVAIGLVQCEAALGEEIREKITRLKWSESTVHEVVSQRFCKKQQMQWSKPGAHLLLQTRVKTLNGDLGAIFKCWYPGKRSRGKLMENQ